MKKQAKLVLMGVMIFSMVITLSSCTAESSEQDTSLAKDLMDTITNTVAENLAEGVIIAEENIVETEYVEDSAEIETAENIMLSGITDFTFAGAKLYAVFSDGLIIYDIENKSQSVIRAKEKMSAVISYQGKIYVGGKYLYQLKDNSLEYLDDFDSRITCFYSYNNELMIGTEDGLYVKGLMGREKLFDDCSVTTITSDNDGLWIGTDGSGLYRWDGEIFKKRYLLRDSTIFDCVYTLDFKHNHLYVGSSNGFHIYDGGRWATYTEKEGLPCNEVVNIDASDWVVYIATDEGVVSFFNGEIKPVEKLNEKRANFVVKRGNKIMISTDHEGILQKSGKSLKTLVQPLEDMNSNLLSLMF